MNENENNCQYLSDELEADKMIDQLYDIYFKELEEEYGRAECNRPTTIQESLN